MKKLIATILILAGMVVSATALACPNCDCEKCDCGQKCECPKK